jgi:hypothetical protein
MKISRDKAKDTDAVNPGHYRNSSGIQLIEFVRYLPFDLGNVLKYTYRSSRKNATEDLKKALWYLNDYNNHRFTGESPEAFTGLIESFMSDASPFEKRSADLVLKLHDQVHSHVDEVSIRKTEAELRELIEAEIAILDR